MKILILPSWYPVDDNKHGQFFRNEAILVSKFAQVTLIYFSLSYVRRRNLKDIIQCLILNKNPKVQKKVSGDFQEIIFSLQLWPNKNVDYPLNRVSNIIEHFIRKERLIYDLIHAHSTLYGGVIASRLSDLLKIPYIITEHQHMPFLLRQVKNPQKLFNILNKSSRVLSVSKYQRQQLLSFGVDNRIDIVGNYINEMVFTLKRDNKRKDVFTILYVAYDGYIKDFKTFVDAIWRLQNEEISEVQINIITSIGNTQINNMLSRICNHKIRVDVYSGVDNDKMPAFYHEADIFVSTSLAETFGVSLVESLFCGTPVISTISGGVLDFLSSKNAILIQVQDSKELYEELYSFYKNNFEFIPSDLRASVLNKYDSINFSNRLLNIYESVIYQESQIHNKP